MTPPPELPWGIPPERVWLPVDGPDSAKASLLWLSALYDKQPISPLFQETDQV